RKFWQDIDSGGHPKHKSTEQKVDGQNVHCLLLATRKAIMPPQGGVGKRARSVVRFQIRGGKGPGNVPGFPLDVCFSLARSLLSCLKNEPIVSEELGKANWLAAERLLHISSHGCGFAFAIEPLQVKQSVRAPFRNARRS